MKHAINCEITEKLSENCTCGASATDFSGWQIVPHEPTDKMVNAPPKPSIQTCHEYHYATAWRMMLAAAPSHPAAESVAALVKAARPLANLLHDDIVPKDAMQKKLQEWAHELRAALAPFGEG